MPKPGQFLAVALALPAFAQLTPEQRQEDFRRLSGIFAYNYAPYEWKRDQFKADLYDVQPWMERIRKAPSDLEAIEVMSEYVASLRDTHSQFQMQANFQASISISTDIADGKIIIDGLSRAALPASAAAISVGDEVIFFDGRDAAGVVTDLARFFGQANERARRRYAAWYLFFRAQALFPRAIEVGDNAVVTIRHAATREIKTYELPWTKRGVPIRQPGPIISPQSVALRTAAAAAPADFLTRYHNRGVNAELARLAGYGSRFPYFSLPADFQLRLGGGAADFHLSGTYSSGGKRIGYLRIPNFSPPSSNAAFSELLRELPFLQENTDGLVVDVSRNTGGGCYGASVLQLLMKASFDLPLDEIRATLSALVDAQSTLQFYRNIRAEAWQIALLEQIVSGIEQAYKENRGRTGPLPFCAETSTLEPFRNNVGQLVGYSKPLILLTDEFTTSWGDTFAATIQDNGRGPNFGYRTNGAGGAVSGDFVGFNSEVYSSYSLTLGTRQKAITTEEYGTSKVLENVGVRPDIPYDYMTVDNIIQQGRPFVAAFTAAILAEIERAAQ